MDVKPGYQTTEFWITLLTNITSTVFLFHPAAIAGQTASGVNAFIPQVAAVLVLIATNVSYFITRSNVKVAAAQAPATTVAPK